MHAYDFFTCGISYFHVELLETQHDTSCPCAFVAIARKWNSHFIFRNSNHSLRLTNVLQIKTTQLKKIILLKYAKEAHIIEENPEVYIYKEIASIVIQFPCGVERKSTRRDLNSIQLMTSGT